MKILLVILLALQSLFALALADDIERIENVNNVELPHFQNNELSNQLKLDVQEFGTYSLVFVTSNVPNIRLNPVIKVTGRCISDTNKLTKSSIAKLSETSKRTLKKGNSAIFIVRCIDINTTTIPTNLGLGNYKL